ncbi:hypothetical protein [Pontibacter sp. SGAir0037]|uniref:hypothetical protein n=1 Tax=Pontibacter sp. SGAir0037 TaxID=2571030 RepID=UPI0010CD5104|nr:hypothetical protein [Pontibacter sp. SGAir0037]QCR24353.1 hypothetical protein C1N53_19635 [Pontibacter sp. SGAir0037]
MKQLCLLSLFLLFALSSFAQTSASIIKKQAEAVSQAVLNKKLELLADHTYPWIMEQMGGRENMIKTLSESMAQMAAQGVVMQQVTVGEPGKVVTAGKELHCIVPQQLTLKVPNGTLTINGHMLAISQDKGAKWYFLDLAQLDNSSLKTIFPDFNQTLVIPEKQQPTFTPEEK